MPQTDFYLCEADLLDIGESFLAQGAKIIPAQEYPIPQVLEISTTKHLKDHLRESNLSLLFVVSPEWQRSPLVVRSVIRGDREIFYVAPKEGGPPLDIFYASPREIDGHQALSPGFISYHSTFWNPGTNSIEKAPSSLANAYRNLVTRLRRGGQSIVRRHRKLTVTKNTLASKLRLIDLKNHVDEKPKLIANV